MGSAQQHNRLKELCLEYRFASVLMAGGGDRSQQCGEWARLYSNSPDEEVVQRKTRELEECRKANGDEPQELEKCWKKVVPSQVGESGPAVVLATMVFCVLAIAFIAWRPVDDLYAFGAATEEVEIGAKAGPDLDLADDDRTLLWAYGVTASFNSWEAIQALGTKAIVQAYHARAGRWRVPSGWADALRQILTDRASSDLSLVAFALTLLPVSTLINQIGHPVDPVRLHDMRNVIRRIIAAELRNDLHQCYKELSPAKGKTAMVDERWLRNVCLDYLAASKDTASLRVCYSQFIEARSSGNLADKLEALGHLVELQQDAEAASALHMFYEDSIGDDSAMSNWFALQVSVDVPDLVSRVKDLMGHRKFLIGNVRHVLAVMGTFVKNVRAFHMDDGSGYRFLTSQIHRLDPLHPSVTAKLVRAFDCWTKLDEKRRPLIREQLLCLRACGQGLSKGTQEVVARVLALGGDPRP